MTFPCGERMGIFFYYYIDLISFGILDFVRHFSFFWLCRIGIICMISPLLDLLCILDVFVEFDYRAILTTSFILMFAVYSWFSIVDIEFEIVLLYSLRVRRELQLGLSCSNVQLQNTRRN